MQRDAAEEHKLPNESPVNCFLAELSSSGPCPLTLTSHPWLIDVRTSGEPQAEEMASLGIDPGGAQAAERTGAIRNRSGIKAGWAAGCRAVDPESKPSERQAAERTGPIQNQSQMGDRPPRT